MVGTGGFEPPTPRTPSVCATRLRHVPTEGLPLYRMWVQTGKEFAHLYSVIMVRIERVSLY